MEADYLAADQPEPVILLGQSLLPFSLGHFKRLLRSGSAYVTGKDPQLSDLVFGVWVCCHTWEEASAGLLSPKLDKNIEKWRKSIGAFDFEEKSEAFTKYVKDGSRWPELHENEQIARMPGAPFIQRVELVLRGKLGCTFSEAVNMPWGKAMHDYFGYWEMEKACRIISEDDLEQIAEARRLRDEIIAEIRGENANKCPLN